MEEKSAEDFVEQLLDRSRGFEALGLAEKLRLKMCSEEQEDDEGFAEKLLEKCDLEEGEDEAFVEKLLVKTGLEEDEEEK